MTKAGLVAVQRFAWTDDHTTPDIQSLMGFEPFRFLETPHFKIASSLTPVTLPTDERARARLRAELRELAGRLHGVDPEARTLDPWLRTHLYAHRLEKLYAEFARRFGVRDEAMAKAKPGTATDPAYAGEGPYLGQRGKYLVVLARTAASVGTYARNFLDLPAPRTPTRHRLDKPGSILLLLAEDLPDEPLRDDAALHGAVAYHAAHALLDGYRHYWHDCPLWFEEGVAHWFALQAESSCASFDRRPAELPANPVAVEWPAKVRARVERGNHRPSEELFRVRNDSARFDDHLLAWSRVDFLLRAHAEAFPLFARQVKGPDPTKVPHVPADAGIAERPTIALRQIFGWSLTEFDDQWAAWVLRTYPKS